MNSLTEEDWEKMEILAKLSPKTDNTTFGWLQHFTMGDYGVLIFSGEGKTWIVRRKRSQDQQFYEVLDIKGEECQLSTP